MKSFDSRLQKELFPKKPDAFDRMVRRQLKNVCGQPENTKDTVVRFAANENASRSDGTVSKRLARIGAVAAAAVLVLCTLAVGAFGVFAGKEKKTPAAPVDVQSTASAGPDTTNTVYAATVDEFLAAIAPDTTIVLTGGTYRLCDASDYGLAGGQYYSWSEVKDGYGLRLNGLENFRLIGSGTTRIEADPRDAEVIDAEHCIGLVLSGLTVGHTEKPEKCSGAVIRMNACQDLRIENCALYGCGTWGVTAWNSEGLTVANSVIYECSSGALHLWDCTDVVVSGSTIRNCGGGGTPADLIYIQDSDVSVQNCEIYGNTTEGSLFNVNYDGTAARRISLTGTAVHDNRLTGRNGFIISYLTDENNRMIVDGCAFKDNTGKLLPANSRVYDCNGNELDEAALAAMTRKRDDPDPTAAPASALPTASAGQDTTNTVSVAAVDEFLAAIAPDTEIVLAAGTYDLTAAAASYAGGNPYVSFVYSDFLADGDRFLKITGVDGLRIRAAEEGACILTAGHCEAVLAAESCSGLTLSGLTFRGDECGVSFRSCSDVRAERCGISAQVAVSVSRCENVTLTDFALDGTILSLYESGKVTVSDADLSGCGFTADFCTDVLVTGCRIHGFQDDRNGETTADGEAGDASYLITLYGRSGSGQSVEFRDCEMDGNRCSNLFTSDGVDRVTLSGLKIHDNCVDKLWNFDESEPAGSHVVSGCTVERNEIGKLLFCGQSETKVFLSETTIADNEIETVFFGGDITVSECAFENSAPAHWTGSDEEYRDLRVSVHDPDGNELDEAAFAAMTQKH